MQLEDIGERLIKEFPTLSKKKLGELLHKRHPDLFKDSEAGRRLIRGITNSAGKTGNNKKDVSHLLKLPEPEGNDFSPFILKSKLTTLLCDIHLPYFHKEALGLAFDRTVDRQPDTLILNGDTIDCYHLSSFEKDPRQRGFKYEIDVLKSFLEQLRNKLPKARIIFKLGNHEERYERFILSQAPALLDLECFTFEEVCQFRNYGVEVVKNKKIIKLGDLNIVHGHEFSRSVMSPVNIARGFFLRAKANIIGGHHHQTSEHFEQDVNEKIVGAWSVGCLSELHPKYMPINKWNHGFAEIESDGKEFEVDNLKIINGKIR
jgi:hypothetical protein